MRILSLEGKAVDPARAAGVDERLLAAALAHVRRIPRRVLAARPVHMTEHGARAVRRYVRVCLRQGHTVRACRQLAQAGSIPTRMTQLRHCWRTSIAA